MPSSVSVLFLYCYIMHYNFNVLFTVKLTILLTVMFINNYVLFTILAFYLLFFVLLDLFVYYIFIYYMFYQLLIKHIVLLTVDHHFSSIITEMWNIWKWKTVFYS